MGGLSARPSSRVLIATLCPAGRLSRLRLVLWSLCQSLWCAEFYVPLMTEESTSNQDSKPRKSCSGKQRAMLAYGVTQITATVVSAISLAAIAVGLCAVKQESKAFNGCVEEVMAAGRRNAEAVRYCNGGRLPKGEWTISQGCRSSAFLRGQCTPLFVCSDRFISSALSSNELQIFDISLFWYFSRLFLTVKIKWNDLNQD